jgi:hypothetical protein
MAVSDPQSVTIGASTISLPRTGQGIDNGVFTSADGNTRLTIQHQPAKGGRFRRLIRLDYTKVAADPFVTTVNAKYTESVYTVMDVPSVGFTAAEELDLYKGLAVLMAASTYALTTKFIGGES